MKQKKPVKKTERKASFVVFGHHAVAKAVQAGRVNLIHYDADRQDKRMQATLAEYKGATSTVDKTVLNDKVGHSNHQGIVAEVAPPAVLSESALDEILQQAEQPFFLVLDQVQDPHNLGACLRTANAVGVDAVIIPKDRAVGMTPVVYKVASGAAEFTPLIQVTNLARTLKMLKSEGIWLVGTSDGTDQTISEQDFTGPLAVIMGAEGVGMRQQTMSLCDYLVKIPMLGDVESLNVSVATGVVLYECLRQRA